MLLVMHNTLYNFTHELDKVQYDYSSLLKKYIYKKTHQKFSTHPYPLQLLSKLRI